MIEKLTRPRKNIAWLTAITLLFLLTLIGYGTFFALTETLAVIPLLGLIAYWPFSAIRQINKIETQDWKTHDK